MFLVSDPVGSYCLSSDFAWVASNFASGSLFGPPLPTRPGGDETARRRRADQVVAHRRGQALLVDREVEREAETLGCGRLTEERSARSTGSRC